MAQNRTLWDCIGATAHSILDALPQRDLATLCLVSKAWRSDAEPYLYAFFESKWHPWEPLHDANQRCPPLDHFLRTILERPDLAEHVRHLRLPGDHSFGRPFRTMFYKYSQLAKDAIDAVDRGLPVEHRFATTWKDEIDYGSRDACITLLVSQLPRLQETTIGDAYIGQTRLLSKLVWAWASTTGGRRFGLRRLNLLTVGNRFSHRPFNRQPMRSFSADILPFMYIPGIETLCLAFCNPETFKWPGPKPPDLSSITTLQLRSVRESHLHHILSLTPNLKVLDFEWWYDAQDRHSTNGPIIQLDILGNALDLVRDTLEELIIWADDTDEDHEESPMVSIQGHLSSLPGYDGLHTMNVPMMFLTGGWGPSSAHLSIGNAVPRGIRHLIINDDLDYHYGPIPIDHDENEWDEKTICPELCRWAETWDSTHPSLETIRVLLLSGRTWTKNSRDELFEAVRAAAVVVEVQEFSPHFYTALGKYQLFKSTDLS